MTTYDKYRQQFGLIDNLVGTNEKKENLIVSIDEEKVEIMTIQSNGYARTNVYWKDGTEEELYDH